jgi:signal transduction histidine kinase
MGLAICRRIAERHGGTLTAQSQPGRGSAFTIRIPALRAAQQEGPTP